MISLQVPSFLLPPAGLLIAFGVAGLLAGALGGLLGGRLRPKAMGWIARLHC